MSEKQESGDNVIRVAFGNNAKTKEAPNPPSAASAEKFDVFSRLIEEGKVLVTIDTRVEGVSVPKANRGEMQLALNFSYRFQVPDFAFDERGVRASLSFAGTPYFCDIPWESVYLMRSDVTEENAVFEQSIPSELTHSEAELTVVLKTYVPKSPDTKALKEKLNTILPLLKAPAGLAGMHTLTDDAEGEVVLMMIWLSDATAAAGQRALRSLEQKSEVLSMLSKPPTTRVLRDA